MGSLCCAGVTALNIDVYSFLIDSTLLVKNNENIITKKLNK